MNFRINQGFCYDARMEFPKTLICETSKVSDGNMDFRFGGRKDVMNNRTAFLEQFGIAYQEHIAMSCDHGEVITLVDGKSEGLGATSLEEQVQSEVLVTQKKHIALMLFTADCIPMSFYDPVTHTIALAHVSRKTLCNNLPQKTVGFLRRECDVAPANLLISMGPHIQKESYSFPLPLPEVPYELNGFIEEKDGSAFIDLSGATLRQLTTAGVKKENVTISPHDTARGGYFSYYRMKKEGNETEARMATILMMR